MKKITFNVSKDDNKIINAIAARAVADVEGSDKLSVAMDLTAVHANGCPLQLRKLLEADDFNFTHDILGIRRHLNRETGELMDFFLPRYAKPK